MARARTVGVFADTLELPKAWALSREPYLVSVFVCDSGDENEIRVQTSPARGIKRGKPLDLEGLELVPVCDPGAFIVGSVTVMESDKDFKRAGEILESARHLFSRTQLGQILARGLGVGSSGAAVAALSEVTGLISDRLRQAGDDEYASFQVKIEADDRRGGFDLSSLIFENDRVRLVLRVAESGESGSPDGFEKPKRWTDVTAGLTAYVEHQGAMKVGEVGGVEGRSATIVFSDGQSTTIKKLGGLLLKSPGPPPAQDPPPPADPPPAEDDAGEAPDAD